MRDRVKSLSFAASLALGAAIWMAPALVAHQQAAAGVFDKDEDINADARRLGKDLSEDGRPAKGTRFAGLFGQSDEDKAAAEAARQHEIAQDSNIQSLMQRMQDLENTVRRLTGQNEALGYKVEELRTALDRSKRDFDYRLCTLSAQQLGASDQEGGLNCGAVGNQQGNLAPLPSAAPPQRYSSAGDTSQQLAPPPGSLGTLSASDVRGGPATTAPRQLASTGTANSTSTNGQYNAAMTLLARARFDEARSAFRSFADTNPDDTLTPQAVYWVGDIAYLQKNYPDAARAFAEQIKKYPQSSRAPDSMLRLGQSLIAMGQKQEGCTTLGALKAKYPKAADTLLDKAREDRKAAGCR